MAIGLVLGVLMPPAAFALCERRGWPFLRAPLQHGLVERVDRDLTICDTKVDAVVAKTLESAPDGATHWSTRTMAREYGL